MNKQTEINLYKNCKICPENCGVNRFEKTGVCAQSANVRIARASVHMWEEPIITGKNGSGTVFFTGCNLKCIFCQNNEISKTHLGLDKTDEELADIFLMLQNEKKSTNINLVTPTHFSPSIMNSLDIAKQKGLKIPVVYNTSGYEKPEIIEMLKGYVDIFLTDFKYSDDSLAKKYSKVSNYTKYAKKSLDKMFEIVGDFVIEDALMKKGVDVRILILPGETEDAKKSIKYIHDKFGDKVILSIMNQYTPTETYKYENLNRKLSKKEYDEVVDYAIEIGVENAFIQEEGTVSESFIPDFASFVGIK